VLPLKKPETQQTTTLRFPELTPEPTGTHNLVVTQSKREAINQSKYSLKKNIIL